MGSIVVVDRRPGIGQMAAVVEVELGVVHSRYASISRELVFPENRQIGEPDGEEYVAVAIKIELPTGPIDLRCELRAIRDRRASEDFNGGVPGVVAREEAHHIRISSLLKIVCVSQIDIALRIRLQSRWECAVSAFVYAREGCASVNAP